MIIRDARPNDIDAITAIYNHAVAHTTAIWNETLADREDRLAWLVQRQGAGWPVLVAVDPRETILGYATYGPWRPHEGYRHTVEHSVYVDPAQQGKGVGTLLMRALIDRARAQKMHVMVGGIEAGNMASLRLHEALGFERTGLLKEVGMKFGRWLDLAFLQLTLDRRSPEDAHPSSDCNSNNRR
ncbi:GNAT family N-acetyltransferase [Acidomonas methanolica]|uniref:Acetyltransferase n=1 Tax=Acidomonas methanolica NBRC 104435 TaxID=1231351 RepID=A0A023D1U4_ACIMT|nr:GNAT family N-acetyltransferase [Acidomonas methanolica]MBU2654535.1 GNAT family N-acetyltransferase [Acidomonas methanolica]TCS27407.1 phosphinothricin acetyltransferase [Acidomonas methanolica]GAJ28112.1 acetyltransferase [Acidomonas methanolica NBRC 104435]GBQ46528.1 acetyltransferase [Acidomonas methanolica]GEK98686.1 N-acetyltransferase [Acidomonas methanolica NBRC 104435]